MVAGSTPAFALEMYEFPEALCDLTGGSCLVASLIYTAGLWALTASGSIAARYLIKKWITVRLNSQPGADVSKLTALYEYAGKLVTSVVIVGFLVIAAAIVSK